jgi:selenide,water dikinase
VLSNILKQSPGFPVPSQLLVGIETSDDAAVYKLNDEQALIATTDFFMPIVDDPFDFGRIAATNAISDVYAMGGTPIMALALVGMPIDKLPIEIIGKILAGGESICAEAGIPVAGGHTIDSVEPIYGLVVMGLIHPDRIKRNSHAKAGDKLILGKPLGVGILSAALKKELLSDAGYQEMIALTTKLNKPGVALAQLEGVHALTDVTGFGLAGHLLEMTRGSKLMAQVQWDAIPVIQEAVEHVKADIFTGASTRNWAGYGSEVQLASNVALWQQNLLTDPQTSGGLLISCAPEQEAEVLSILNLGGFASAKKIGRFVAGTGLSVQ